jgi:Ca2+-binding EF-hand superfamily protein
MFDAMDVDANKNIDKPEMRRMLFTLLSLTEHLIDSKNNSKRLEAMYQKHPFMNGLPLRYCVMVLANLMTERIFQEADIDRNANLSYSEFHKWFDAKTPDGRFIDALFRHFATELTHN